MPHGTQELYFELCGKKVLLNASIKSAQSLAEHVLEEYGQRALAAEKNRGVDWKALSHAVRVGHEALEFLRDHTLTFPRPEADHLLAIKQGFVDYKQVADEIERLVLEVQNAAGASSLPETYDSRVIDAFIKNLYQDQILKGARV